MRSASKSHAGQDPEDRSRSARTKKMMASELVEDSSQAPILRLERVAVRYGGNFAIQDLSLELFEGEILAVMGPNGAGKSTLLRAIMGLQTLASGQIFLREQDVTRHSFRKRCRSGFSLTFQIPRAVADLTVEEQLAAQTKGFHHRYAPRSRSRLSRVAEVVAMLELDRVVSRRPGELTLGEERRFELARALINRPSVLLVDEPSSGMSADEARVLAAALSEISRGGVAIVLVEHNVPFIASLAKRALVLDAGQLLLAGETKTVLASDTVKEAYLGTATTQG